MVTNLYIELALWFRGCAGAALPCAKRAAFAAPSDTPAGAASARAPARSARRSARELRRRGLHF